MTETEVPTEEGKVTAWDVRTGKAEASFRGRVFRPIGNRYYSPKVATPFWFGAGKMLVAREGMVQLVGRMGKVVAQYKGHIGTELGMDTGSPVTRRFAHHRGQ